MRQTKMRVMMSKHIVCYSGDKGVANAMAAQWG